MKYIALLRGINVGGNRKVEMKKLKLVFEKMGFSNVSTYINSGNVIFESSKKPEKNKIEISMQKEFGFDNQVLIKTEKEMKKIAKAIPEEWKNDTEQRTDVAYLFKEIDHKKIIVELPINKEFSDVRYISGAIFWNIRRKNYNKSHLNKLVGHEMYQLMTVRNINTARYLAGVK